MFLAIKFMIRAFVILLCLNIHPSNGLRILGLFPFQVRSHFTMCEALMRGLAERGHHVDVYSHFPLKRPIPNYKDFSLHGTLPDVTNNMSFDTLSVSSLSESMEYWLEVQGNSVCNLMELPLFQKLLHNPPTDPPYDLVINEVNYPYFFDII